MLARFTSLKLWITHKTWQKRTWRDYLYTCKERLTQQITPTAKKNKQILIM